MTKIKIIWNFAIPILCALFGITFLSYYFFGRYNNQDWLIYGVMFFIVGGIWFKVLYKGYKLLKAEEKGTPIAKTEKSAEIQKPPKTDSPAARYWKKFMWVVVILFVLGIIIRYLLGVYN